MAIKVKKSDYVLVEFHGPVYVTDSFRDSGGTVWNGINGKDGVNYQFYASEVVRKLSRDEFDSIVASIPQS